MPIPKIWEKYILNCDLNEILTLKFEEEICEAIEYCMNVCYENGGKIYCGNDEFNNHEYINREVNNKLSDIESIFKDNTQLNEEQKLQMIELLHKYSKVFSEKPGRCTLYQHRINIKNPHSYRAQRYPIPTSRNETKLIACYKKT